MIHSARECTGECRLTDLALYCAVPYIAACVDVSRTVFRDRSVGPSIASVNFLIKIEFIFLEIHAFVTQQANFTRLENYIKVRVAPFAFKLTLFGG